MCSILGNQAECLPEDSLGTFLQTLRLENLGITYYCMSHISNTVVASAATQCNVARSIHYILNCVIDILQVCLSQLRNAGILHC